MSMKWFRVPRDIVFGEGTLSHLQTLQGKRAVLVTGGSSMKRFGFLEQAEGYLRGAGFDVATIDGVEPNPSVATVLRGATAMREFEPDWVVAIGGGSALDAAKIMWAFYEHPELTFQDIIEPCSLPTLRQKARFVAIPSTSGTASEITAFSVITDTENHIKYPIVSYEITPDLAILDPALPMRMPPHVTANTGMDVMAHAVEAVASTNASSYTDPLAVEAIRLVAEWLPSGYADGQDMVAREHMHNASTLAGMAFTNSSLGLVHSLAHKIGGEFGVTHGLANAILMPAVVAYNKAHTAKYALVEQAFGGKDLVTTLRALNERLGISQTFAEVTEVTIPEDSFLAVLDRMSANAHADPCTLTNPGTPTVDDVKSIYRAAYYGA